MKFHETHFEEYIQKTTLINLHPKLNKIFNKFPKTLNELKNLIFYGPSGTGKYTQMLKSIAKYSPSGLKYEKKISLIHNKTPYFLKISDIHYEVDMALLGCNSKSLWNDIYHHIIDILSATTTKVGIIVCKNFNEIHSELLDNFYSYMQKNVVSLIDIKFIIITEQISFIPDNILNCCETINVARPSKLSYSKCVNSTALSKIKLSSITNIKMVYNYNECLMLKHKVICDKIIKMMNNIDCLDFLIFRDTIYDLFIYNIDIYEGVWYIIKALIEQNKIKQQNVSPALIRTFIFFQYYNNNYRPIYHVENYFLYLMKLIYSLDDI
tara:strand:+ start:1369 stop:2340 length:972 start_codon:yes stop_codon:yes gene_type:complete